MFGRGYGLIVMAGLGPAIRVFADGIKERRGWPAFADHEGGWVGPLAKNLQRAL
jgi:hypothetical protein